MWVGGVADSQTRSKPLNKKSPQKSPFLTQISPLVFPNLTKTIGWVGGFIHLGKLSQRKVFFETFPSKINVSEWKGEQPRFLLGFSGNHLAWPPGHLKCKNYRQAGYPWKELSKCSSAVLKFPSYDTPVKSYGLTCFFFWEISHCILECKFKLAGNLSLMGLFFFIIH